jgi:hypothetical protein
MAVRDGRWLMKACLVYRQTAAAPPVAVASQWCGRYAKRLHFDRE